MAYFVINILSKSKGRITLGLNHPDGKFFPGELEVRLNGVIGYDYEISSIDPVDEEQYKILERSFYNFDRK